MKWDVRPTWEACFHRWEALTDIPAECRTEAEERARYALARWLERHTSGRLPTA